LAALLPRQKRSAAAPLLEAVEASCEAAIGLLGVEFGEAPAETPAAEAGGCPKCGAPAVRQRNVSGMGEGPAEWLCLDCGEEYQR
jgi:hypothetical protein